AVGGIGVPDGKLPGVVLGLRHAFGEWFVPRLRLDDGELVIAIDEDVVGNEPLAAAPVACKAALGDLVLPRNAAALHHAPPRRLEGGIDVFGSGLGFVHGAAL